MKRVILLAVAACSGGSKPTTKPTNPTAPGVVWETAAEPWRVLHSGYASAIDGDRVTFGGPNGWVHQFDLATGKSLRARKLEMGTVTSLIDLGEGRTLAVGFASSDIYSPPAAFVLDGAFEPKAVTLPVRAVSKGAIAFPRAIKLGDSVVISGAGLVLSIYDPKDLSVRSTLDQAIGWSKIGGRGEILLAERGNSLKRFDLSTNGQRDLGYGISSHLVVGEDADIIRVARDGKWIAELIRADKTKLVLPDEIDSLHDYDGKRFITTKQNELRIHELPSGDIKKRIVVGDQAVSLSALRVSGKRAVASYNGAVRVIDLETGTVTPKDATARQGNWLAVGNDGAVLAGTATSMWSMAGGKVTATENFGNDQVIETLRSDDPRHYVMSRTVDKASTLEVHTVGAKAVRTIEVKLALDASFLARDGSLVLATSDGDHKYVMRAKDGKPTQLFEFNHDADVLTADPDGDILIAVDGRVAVAGQDGKLTSTLRLPHCEKIYQTAALDLASGRAVTFDYKDLALWDRKTGKLLANVKTGSFDDLVFVPGRAEIVMTFDDRVVVWSPTKGTRTLRWPGVLEPAVSADGKKLALSFHDGRIGVYDLDALLAAPIEADLPAGDAIAETCGDDDPLAVSRPDEDLDHVEPTGDDAWDDED